MESFETKKITSNWGILIANKLQCHNLYTSQKWIHYNHGF
jgi:hypothetical protein